MYFLGMLLGNLCSLLTNLVEMGGTDRSPMLLPVIWSLLGIVYMKHEVTHLLFHRYLLCNSMEVGCLEWKIALFPLACMLGWSPKQTPQYILLVVIHRHHRYYYNLTHKQFENQRAIYAVHRIPKFHDCCLVGGCSQFWPPKECPVTIL